MIGVPILAPTIMDGMETISSGLLIVVSIINLGLDVGATPVQLHRRMEMECMNLQGSTAFHHGMVVLTTTIQHCLHIVASINTHAVI